VQSFKRGIGFSYTEEFSQWSMSYTTYDFSVDPFKNFFCVSTVHSFPYSHDELSDCSCFRMLQAKGCPVYGSLEPDLGPCLPKLPKEKTIGKKFSFFTSHEI
jgi:hypothetical protein